MRSIPVVWLYSGSQLLEELHPWDGAGEPSRDQIPSRALRQLSKGGLQPWVGFSCPKFQNAHGKLFLRTKKKRHDS